MRRILKLIKLTFLISVMAGSYAAYDIYSYYSKPGPLKQNTIVLIEKGQSLKSIANKLHQKDVISNPFYFLINLKLRNQSTKIRAGEFEIAAGASPAEVFHTLHKGAFVHYPFTVPEGLTVAEVLVDLNEVEKLIKDDLPTIREGSLHPETYHFVRDTRHSTLIARMQDHADRALAIAWEASHTKDVLKTPEQLRTLASIVEKETAIVAERPRIAAVFINRLRKGMLLQSDPCVIYGLELVRGEEIHQLTSKDLKTDTPFNTYIHPGLPPHAICNVGSAALLAVANPMETDELFFVADGTGGHVFAKTYAEHRRNHIKWRKIRKELQKN